MRIEHIALYYRDLDRARDFFCQWFGAQSNNGYRNPNTNFRSYFLTFPGEARLELMEKPLLEDLPKPLNRTGYAHLAFCLGSVEAVDTMTAELKKAGFQILSGPRTTGDGYYESCFLDFEGNQIEITA